MRQIQAELPKLPTSPRSKETSNFPIRSSISIWTQTNGSWLQKVRIWTRNKSGRCSKKSDFKSCRTQPFHCKVSFWFSSGALNALWFHHASTTTRLFKSQTMLNATSTLAVSKMSFRRASGRTCSRSSSSRVSLLSIREVSHLSNKALTMACRTRPGLTSTELTDTVSRCPYQLCQTLCTTIRIFYRTSQTERLTPHLIGLNRCP